MHGNKAISTKIRKRLLISCLTLSLLGCAIGPDYRRPEIETPPAWRYAEKEARELANTAWWEQFSDPVLNELIRIALRENKDLRVATAAVEEFYGRYGATRADLFPQFNYNGQAGKERVPATPGANPTTSKFYQIAFNASWELDIWGKLRRATEAARADLLGTEEARRGVILTLVTSVATSYVDLRGLQRQLEIAIQTTKSREESLNLFTVRFKAGTISEVELNQVTSQFYEAQATIPDLKKRIVQQENLLSILLGRNPGPVASGRSINELALPAVPAGLPSDLLVRRPDIVQAEQQLISANARIGVAKGQYFPTISLTGLLGTASAALSDLFTGPSKIWSYAGTVTGPLFTFGKIKGAVKAAEAVQQEALFNYQRSIQNGFREVNDSLEDQARTREQLESQARQVESLRRYAQLSRVRYDNGYTSYLEVLDAERSLFNAELSYTQTQEALFRAMVNLYKAMGGGWLLEADRIATTPPVPVPPAAVPAAEKTK